MSRLEYMTAKRLEASRTRRRLFWSLFAEAVLYIVAPAIVLGSLAAILWLLWAYVLLNLAGLA